MSSSPHSARIPVIFLIDAEPDEFDVDRKNPKPWNGFEFTHDYLKELRPKFEEATQHNVHLNWSLRMDPQIAISYGSASWIADKYPAHLEEYMSLGDELGVHVHNYRWSKSRDAWVDDGGNAEWESECLQSSIESFKQSFGQAARTLRYGNFWMSTRGINEAESLGIEYDVSLEPGRSSTPWSYGKPYQTHPTPSFHRVPRVPYRPSREDYRKPDASSDFRNILMIPMTSSYEKYGWGLKGMRRRLGRIRHNGFRGRLQCRPLSMWRNWEGENSFSKLIDRALAVQERPYLAMAIRTDINGKAFPNYDSCMKALLNHSASSRFVFCTPKEAMEIIGSGV